MKKRRA